MELKNKISEEIFSEMNKLINPEINEKDQKLILAMECLNGASELLDRMQCHAQAEILTIVAESLK